MLIYFEAYLAIGLVFCELVLYADKQRGHKPSIRQYLNLTFLYPLCICVVLINKLNR